MIYLGELLSNPVETLSLEATIDTALCVGAGGSSGSLADKPIVRTAGGKLLIPASQIKGRLRHECEKLARGLKWPICVSPNPKTMCPKRDGATENFEGEYDKINEEYHCIICQTFGNPTLPSRVIFDDLICTTPAEDFPTEVLRPGVTINRYRRTAEENKLFFLETSSPNAKLTFIGEIHLQADCPSYTKALIVAGLRHITALGGSKSVGLGWLEWQFTPKISIDNEAWQQLLPKNLR